MRSVCAKAGAASWHRSAAGRTERKVIARFCYKLPPSTLGGGTMDSMMVKSRLLFPQLRGFYAWAEPFSWLLIRATAGLMLLPHGWPKLMMGVGKTAEMALIQRRIAPAQTRPIALI